MIKCIAIDDEPLALKQLTAYLQKVPFFEVAGSCISAMEAMRLMETVKPDVIFIDINMPDLSGLDYVRSLNHPPMVVFTTAYSEYAIDGYKVNAIDYLLKPFGLGDVMTAANKVKRQYDLMHADNVSPMDADSALFVKTKYKVVRIEVPDIIYIEGMSEYLRIHLASDTKPLTVLLSMKKMEERLEGHGFMRLHKSYIVNLSCIREISKSRVILSDGKDVPIGESFREKLNEFVANKFIR